ncbi:dynamin, putative [Entamoeba invadens IP1]|uniref:Dynamin, putative n=1 Tax=Entamoeba invadens IP1 TaxID=370355 RepID=A0A0A1U3V3_ENTIV|nr:dynamin, putative [Entamoeba invadens IP1]ELP86284.1 dynamin, putative [Entamoeba invadens IP1]|eukprot:XP_004185630.1 dynamin, putative [Entamoeba invadens IP1]
MQRLIPIINSLQDVFTAAGLPNTLPLPQIVVVGSQSSGKSSVLEHVVGKDFLPRGSGIVTRRPLIVQCVRTDVPKEYGLFEHQGDKQYFDFNAIRDEITAETQRTCPGRNVSPTPIRLRIVSPNVVDLTLVDLPGLVKVTVVGQSNEIVKNLRDMVYQYAAPENALILAVTAGNVDIANSDALNVAKEVDPDGERTIGVLTKLDLEDKGTNSMDVLMGRVYPLKLGYIGVVNRSQQDINNGMDVQTSLKNEKKFFEDHPVYCSIADRMGTEYMVNRLNLLLLQHIQKCLPGLRQQINEAYEKARNRYDEIKPDDDNVLSVSLQQIMKFSTAFSNALNGNNTDFKTHELAGGAKIFSVFESQFSPNIDGQNILAGIRDIDILTAIKNASGTRPCLYVPQTAFENLIAKQVRNFEGSCHQCVDTVYSELKSIVSKTAKENVEKYDRFREALIQATTEVMNEYMTQTHRMVQDLIDIEADYVNTSHPDFDTTKVLKEADEAMKTPEDAVVDSSKQEVYVEVTAQPRQGEVKKQSHFANKLSNAPQQKQSANPKQQQQTVAQTSSIRVDHTNQREMREIGLIRNLCRDYLLIVKKSMKDLVPKSIIHFLVFKTRDSVQKELIKKLYNETLLQDLLAENPALVNERKVVKQNLDALKQALEIINNVRDKCF